MHYIRFLVDDNVFFFFFSPVPNSPLKRFLDKTSKMTPEERAAFLEKDEVLNRKQPIVPIVIIRLICCIES